jgi:hypothetical protein
LFISEPSEQTWFNNIREAVVFTRVNLQFLNASFFPMLSSSNKKTKPLELRLLMGSMALLVLLGSGCNGSSYGIVQPNPEDLCKCLPIEPAILDFRHLAKHVPIPAIAAQEIGVNTILSWTQDAFVAPDAPRTGRELEVFHVANAFLQEASVNAADCDVHFEISQTADKNTPRVIVETPVDSEFCTARQNVQSQLAKHGFKLDSQNGGELPQGLPVEILGMAFEDFDHNRGSVHVATTWELHPATVNLLP